MRLRVCDPAEWRQLAPQWTRLVEAANASVFLSAEWIGLWLQIFGPQLDVRVLVFEHDGEIVGAFLLSGSRTGLRLLPVWRLSLNASGEPSADTTYVEYNNVLCRPGWEKRVAERLGQYIENLRWDEFALDGFVDGFVQNTLRERLQQLGCEEVRHPSYYVDLAEVRRSGEKFESVLKSPQRKHLRQNIRYYGEIGPLNFTVAADVPSALEMLDELATLSQARSAALGRRGIFASERFRTFHRLLVSRHIATGTVQMMRLTAGERTVGVVYNLVHRGRVYFYQCGYNYTGDKRLSPGTVTLSFAIQHFLDAGLDDYDFLSGEAKYKEWMSTGSRNLTWILWRRPSVRSGLLTGLREIRRRLIARQGHS